MQIGNKIFDTEHHTAVMAILNVTPDSFSDGDSYKNMDDIRRRVSQMIEEGAEIIDIGGESTRPGHIQISDEKMAGLIANAGVSCCLMHNREKIDYRDFLPDCMADIRKIIETAKVAGIAEDKMILDPGVGFGKTLEQNLMVMKHLNDFNQFGYPVLLGTSRKSMIGLTLDLPVDQRVEGTITTSVWAVQAHYGFVRVHDVAANYRAVRMAEAIMNAQ